MQDYRPTGKTYTIISKNRMHFKYHTRAVAVHYSLSYSLRMLLSNTSKNRGSNSEETDTGKIQIKIQIQEKLLIGIEI